MSWNSVINPGSPGKVGEIISRTRKCVICSLSAPGDLPEDLFVDRGITYVRFHGKDDWYRHDYSDGELEKWAEKIAGSGTRRSLRTAGHRKISTHIMISWLLSPVR